MTADELGRCHPSYETDDDGVLVVRLAPRNGEVYLAQEPEESGLYRMTIRETSRHASLLCSSPAAALRKAANVLTMWEEMDDPASSDCPTCGGSGGGFYPMGCRACRGTGTRRVARAAEDE